MKKNIFFSSVVVTALFATNGDNLIGVGVESRALGGTGIASFNGAENALSNPALLSKSIYNKEFSFGATIFDANVKVITTNGMPASSGNGISRVSKQDKSMIPVIAILHKINEKFVFGLGMYGTAGMGTDWRQGDSPSKGQIGLYNMRSNLMLMQFAPSIAYKNKNYGIGITTIMQYGELSIDFDTTDNNNPKHIGSGPSQDYGYGYQIGGYYDINEKFTIGAVYKSLINMEYQYQITDATRAFGLSGFDDHLEQPAEFGIGISHKLSKMTYTFDIKKIYWSKAKGYKNFGWEDQNIIGIGAKYSVKSYWWGIGYNKANNPIPKNQDDRLNLANYAMFPATITTHYTMGMGINLTKDMNFSIAYVYAPEVSDTVSGNNVGVGNITTKHSENSLTLAVKYHF